MLVEMHPSCHTHTEYTFLCFDQAARSFMSSGAFRPFVRGPCVVHASLDLQHPEKGTFRCGVHRYSSEEACYKKGTLSLPTFFVCQGSKRAHSFCSCTNSSSFLVVNHICPAMPSRKNNSLEKDARSYNDSMRTKYESLQDYYTRFPNSWARIRYNVVTH